jgi:glycosyltransferase involved in cell wall biosynthesis
MSEYQVIWNGIVHDSQGYARASREYLLALDRAGVDVKIEPLNFGTPSVPLDPEQAKRINELIAKPLATDKKKILIYHAQPYGIDIPKAKQIYDYVIVNTVWETTKIPDQWFPNVNYADAVIVPSTQNVQALRDSGVSVPIFLVPHGADVKAYNPDNEPLPLLNVEDKFTFLSVFQWQHRKAPDVLLKAYWNEFSKKDNVALIIKTFWGNSALRSDQMAIINNIAEYKRALGFTEENTADIYLTPSVFSDEQMKSLYTMADIYVLPSRGEGVGLPYIEALSSGIPAIATAWGGQTDFLNDGNSYPVSYTMASTQAVNGVAPHFFHLFTPDMLWAEPSIESLQYQMRKAYENQEEVKEKGRQGRIDMQNMSWDKSGEIMKKYLDELK